MAKKGTRRRNTSSASTATKERPSEDIQEVEDEFSKTTEGTGQIEVKESKSPPPQYQKSTVISDREREIRDNKLTSDVPELIPFDKLTWGNNVRTPKTLRLEDMIHSLKTRGYDNKYPIVVSKHGTEYLVLCGNRRTEALKAIKETEPRIFKTILKDGKIPALIYDELDPDEETIIRNDHSSEEDRVGLDEVGEFYAIKQLVRAGYDTEADIAAKMNKFLEDKSGNIRPNRSYIQPRVRLARLPDDVQAEFIKLWDEGKHSTHVRVGQIQKLASLYESGRKASHLDGGPKFKEFWDECKNPPQDDDSSSESGGKAKSLTKSEIEKLATQTSSLTILRSLNYVKGEQVLDESGKPMAWNAIDDYAVQAEKAMEDLVAIAEELGQDRYAKLMEKIVKKRQAAAKS